MEQDDIERQLLDTYIQAIVAPTLATARNVKVKKYTQELRKAVASHLRYEEGISLATIARHLDVSERWVSRVTNEEPSDEPFEGWYMAIMDVMTVAYPEALTSVEVQKLLRRKKGRISLIGVETHLGLYCRFGKLVKVGDRYQARGAKTLGLDPAARDKVVKVGKRLRSLDPLCQSYVRGDQGSTLGQLTGQMDVGCLGDAVAEIQKATEAIMWKYTEHSRLLEASGEARLVNYGGLVLIGQLPAGRAKGEDP